MSAHPHAFAAAYYGRLAAQATCWASQTAAAEATATDATDADAEALNRVGDDAADELLTKAGELPLYMADDQRQAFTRGVRYHEAWNGLQLREGLTCDEIVEACIWSPAGADLRHAMDVLRERLRGIAHKSHAAAVEKIARRMLAEERGGVDA
jgi:hypothetical protein